MYSVRAFLGEIFLPVMKHGIQFIHALRVGARMGFPGSFYINLQQEKKVIIIRLYGWIVFLFPFITIEEFPSKKGDSS